jgi:probable phosphoglycerate mutase
VSADVVVVRHGETEWSRSGRHTGTTDLELTPAGRAAAERLGSALSAWTFSLVLTSPLRRAAETARLAGFAATVEPDLVEWAYGDYEGLTTPEIRESVPGWTVWSHVSPGGESGADVGARVDRVILQARASSGLVLVVAHGHVLRVLAARWLGLAPADGRLLALDPATVSVLGWERETPVVRRWNAPVS